MRSTVLLLGLAAWPFALHAAPNAKIAFDVPASGADRALKLFSEQAGLEVLFLTETAADVRTNPLKGEFTPREAIDRLLAGTKLKAIQNEKTGALRIVPLADPNAPRVAQPDQRPASPRENHPNKSLSSQPSSSSMPSAKPASATKRLFVALTTFLLGPIAAEAQPTAPAAAPSDAAHGAIVGQVLNEATKDYLSGATVRVDGSRYETVTASGGEFRLSLPPGEHVLVVTYLGMNPSRVSVNVQPGQTATVNVPLSADIYKLEAFTVKGLREGQAAAIEAQRQAMNVKSMAAIDAYGNPGASMGELMQRLPGIAVDLGAGGEPTAIYVRGMNQNFTSMMVDGAALPVSDGQTVSSNYMTLGSISTNNIEALEIIKAPTPDMDGNAIAGYVNLRTKRAFDKAPGQDVALTVGTKWADLGYDKSVPGRDLAKLDLIALGYSNVFSVFGGVNNLGVSATATLNSSPRYTRETGPWLFAGYANQFFVAPPAAGADPQPLLRGWGEGHYNSNTAQDYNQNFGLNIDYKLGPDTVLWAKSNFNDTRTDKGAYPAQMRWKVFASGQSAATFLPGSTYDVVTTAPTAGQVDLDSNLYAQSRKAYGFTGGIERKLFGKTGLLTLEGNYSKDRGGFEAINEVKARLTGIGFRIDRRGRDEWSPLITQTAGPDWHNPANYSIAPSQTTGSRLIDFDVPSARSNYRADFKQDLDFALPSYVKVGAKYATMRMTSNRRYRHFDWVGPGGTPATGGISNYVGFNVNEGDDGLYGAFPFLQIPTSGRQNDLWANPSNWRTSPVQAWTGTIQSLDSYVEVQQAISAAYAMGQVKWNRLRLLAGVRLEQTDNQAKGRKRNQISTGPNANTSSASLSVEENIRRANSQYGETSTVKSDYRNVFPGLHLVHRFADNFQARASYNVSITRPSPDEIREKTLVNEDSRIITKGNADLKPYLSDNFEFRLEYYMGSIGQLSAGVFLKEISDYFRSFDSLVPAGADNGFEGNYASYTLRMNRNIGNARIRGAEFEYVQQFNFLPAWARGFSFDANYTLLETRGDFGALTTVTRLPNFTPRTLNAGINYKRGRFDVRLLGNYRGRTYVSSTTAANMGTGGWVGPFVMDLYADSRVLLDVKTSLRLNRTFSLYVDVYNLTNQLSISQSFTLAGKSYKFRAQREGTNFHAGVKARF